MNKAECTFMKYAEAQRKDNTYNTKDSLEQLVPGAATGVLSTFVTSPISQVGNMKASRPEEFANKNWLQVTKSLYNMPNESSSQKKLNTHIKSLERERQLHERINNTEGMKLVDHDLEIANKAKDLLGPAKKMGVKSFYAGFGSQAIKNALFSGVMFAALPAFTSLYKKMTHSKSNSNSPTLSTN